MLKLTRGWRLWWSTRNFSSFEEEAARRAEKDRAGNATIFEKIARKELPAKIVFEDSECVAFEDVAPQAPVHLLVIPKRKISMLDDCQSSDGKVNLVLIIIIIIIMQFYFVSVPLMIVDTSYGIYVSPQDVFTINRVRTMFTDFGSSVVDCKNVRQKNVSSWLQNSYKQWERRRSERLPSSHTHIGR